MIFVTVGTHEQPFDRLVKEIDRLKKIGRIEERVFIQSGYSTYQPRSCEYARFIKFQEMIDMIKQARIIITHGGPGSIMSVLYRGKVPLVVPRQKKYGEHVDDHQVHFCQSFQKKGKIIVAYEREEIEEKIKNYQHLIKKLQKRDEGVTHKMKVHNFALVVEKLCNELLTEKTDKLNEGINGDK